MEVPLARQGLVLISGDHRDTTAASSNGAGKTTLFKAITWVLYGRTVDEMKGDEVIRRGTKRAAAVLVLRNDEQRWFVHRTRRKGRPLLWIDVEQCALDFEPGGLHSEWLESEAPGVGAMDGDPKELQAKIVEFLGLDFQAFKNTVLHGQNDNFKFTDERTKDADRKDVIHRVLRTETLQAAHELAKERAKVIRAEIDAATAKIRECNVRVETLDVDSVVARRAAWNVDRKARAEMAMGPARRMKRLAEESLREAPDLAGMGERLEELKGAYDEATADAEGMSEAGRAVDKLSTEVEECAGIVNQLGHEVGTARTELARFDSGICPTCTAPLGKGAPQRYVRGVARRLEVAEAECVAETAAWEERRKKWQAAKRSLRLKRASDDTARELDGQYRHLFVKSEEAKEHGDKTQEFIRRAQQAVAEAKRIRAEENPHEEAVVEAQAKAKAISKERKAHKRELRRLEGEAAYVRFWVVGFSPNGLPSLLLDAVMPFLTEKANDCLEVLADGDISMSLSTQRALKSQDGMKDEIDVRWTIEGNEGVARSSGQRTKMNLAMDMALLELAASREGACLDLLLIDEALDGLDKLGTARTLRLLHSMRSKRGTIFVVSHDDGVTDMFTRGLCVVREDGVSRLEEVR